MDTRKCSRCKILKPLEGFPKNLGKPKGLNYRCKSCCVLTATEHRLKKFGTHRNANLIYKYGITADDYDKMYEEQKGLCWICQKNKDLVVDHCHATGNIRGLLCQNCNTGLGMFEDNKEFLSRAVGYL